jgi:hypothetical protein
MIQALQLNCPWLRVILKGKVIQDSVTVASLDLKDSDFFVVTPIASNSPSAKPIPTAGMAGAPPADGVPPQPAGKAPLWLRQASRAAAKERILLAQFARDEVEEIRALQAIGNAPLATVVTAFLQANCNRDRAAQILATRNRPR